MHLNGRLPGDWGASQTTQRGSHLQRRETRKDDNSPDRTIPFIVVGVIVGILVISSAAVLWTRGRKRKNRAGQPATRSATTKGWRRILHPFSSQSYHATSSDESSELGSTSRILRRDVEQTSNSRSRTNRNNNGTSAAIDRNTSIRSVLTLPAYSHAAASGEQVIGREGDRDGVDIVVDFPTEEDEEGLREQEMDALYQLRSARRQQNQERGTLRTERREAQQRNDFAALAEIRRRQRAASNSNNNLVEELRREIDRAKDNRVRSVSSVSYAELGVARHDGTRLRANSQESERIGLLADAADMGSLAPRSGVESPSPHHRDRSASSRASIDSDFPSPALAHPRTDPRPTTPSRLSYGHTRAGSSPELIESDLGVEAMPPPEYEDVPLDEDDSMRRSTTPSYEPPPDYPGPYRSGSQGSRRSEHDRSQSDPSRQESHTEHPRGRGVGGVPQLPSLRIGRLPQIVVEPSSAVRRDSRDENGVSPERA